MSKFHGGSIHFPNNLCHEILEDTKPAMIPKTPDNIVEELIEKNFQSGDFSCMLPREKEAIRNSIKQALVIGANQALSVNENAYPGAQEMLDAATAFEETLPPGSNITRQRAHYPWGWGYCDRNIQEQYRLFYIANRNKS